MLKSVQFMESKQNESDVKLSNLSKTVDDVVDRLSKVEHMCQTSNGLSTMNIITHSNRDLLITAIINEDKKMKKEIYCYTVEVRLSGTRLTGKFD